MKRVVLCLLALVTVVGAVTATWTFNGRWNPEQHIRDLWNVLAY